MGVEGTCRSANRGGPFLYAHIYSQTPFFHPASVLPAFLPSWQIFSNQGQNRAKVRFSLVCFGVFSGKSETKNGKNKDIFYFWGFRGAAFILFCGGGGGVHWVQAVQALGVCPRFRGVTRPFLPAFALLLPLLSYDTCKICLISHFKGVFRGFWGADDLYGLSLCVDCGAFVCVSG